MTVKLTPITEEELLEKVKVALNLNGNDFQDATVSVWIESVKQDLIQAGVKADVLGSTCAVGCIAKGVSDIWIDHSTEYSQMFDRMAYRLADTEAEQ